MHGWSMYVLQPTVVRIGRVNQRLNMMDLSLSHLTGNSFITGQGTLCIFHQRETDRDRQKQRENQGYGKPGNQ